MDGGGSRVGWGDVDIAHVVEAVLTDGVVFGDDGVGRIVVGDPAAGFVGNRALDPGVDVWIGRCMVFRRDNGAVDVGRVQSENAFDAAGVVDKVNVALAGGGFGLAMDPFDVVTGACVVSMENGAVPGRGTVGAAVG